MDDRYAWLRGIGLCLQACCDVCISHDLSAALNALWAVHNPGQVGEIGGETPHPNPLLNVKCTSKIFGKCQADFQRREGRHLGFGRQLGTPPILRVKNSREKKRFAEGNWMFLNEYPTPPRAQKG